MKIEINIRNYKKNISEIYKELREYLSEFSKVDKIEIKVSSEYDKI